MSHSHSCRQYNKRLLIRIGMQTKTHLSRILFGRFWQKQIVLIKIYIKIIITFNCCSDEWLYFPRDLQLRTHGQDKNYNCFLACHPHSRVQLCISSGQIDSTGLHSQIPPPHSRPDRRFRQCWSVTRWRRPVSSCHYQHLDFTRVIHSLRLCRVYLIGASDRLERSPGSPLPIPD